MDFKINLKELMKENDLTLYRLDKLCDLCINTLRSLIRNPHQNANLNSLSILSQVIDCSIKDLIEDDPAIIHYERIAEENKNRPLYGQNQVFSPDNTKFLRQLLLHVGVSCNISSYSQYRSVSVKNEYELSSIKIDLNLRVVEIDNKSILKIIDFYVYVNQALLTEAVIKEAVVQALELYAQRLNFDEIHFLVIQDFQREPDLISNKYSDLSADFSYTLGTESDLFTQKNYQLSSNPYFLDYQIEWRKSFNTYS